jgi:iron complex outermembrane recepter protein
MKSIILLAGAISTTVYAHTLFAIQPVKAESLAKTENSKAVTALLAQANVEIITVTGVQANPTAQGVEVILQTSQGEQLQITNRSTDNNYIVEIPNAQLRLPTGEAFTFRSENPITSITEITVTNQDANTIKVSVIGETNLPTAQLFDSDEGLIFAFTTVTTSTTESEQPSAEAQQPIELIITGEQDRYRVPNAATVTRIDTPLIDIPQSIQVIPQQVLEDQQIVRIDDALRNVPGVLGSTNAFIGNQITIRGFSTSNLPILRDGFRIYENFSFQETSNLERIEVLKGPASVQYGQLEPGGVINLVTKRPLSTPFYELQFQLGSYGLVRPSFDVSGPLTNDGKLLYRLNGNYQREDGFRNFNTETERFFIAPSLTWNISDRTNLNFSLEYLDSTRPFDTGLVAFGGGVADVPYSRVFSEPDDFIDTSFLSIGYNLEHQFNHNWTIRNAFRYVKQNLFTQATLAGPLNETTGNLTRTYAQREYDSDEYSLQTNVVGKFTTGSLQHTLLVGVDFNRSNLDDVVFRGTQTTLNIFNPVYGVPPRPDLSTFPPATPFKNETTRLGFYLQDQIALNNQFTVLAGLRYDTVNFTDTFTDEGKYDSAWSPVIGLVYKPLENVSLYTSYSRSFVPSFSRDANGDFLRPERGAGYEIGMKAELLQGNLFTTLAYFDITKQNVATADPEVLGASVATGEQRSRGIELSALGRIAPGWNIIAGYAYTDAEITEDNTIPVGNRLPGTPRHSASLWTTYEIQSGSLQGLGFGLGVNYVGKRFGNFQNNFEVDSYLLTNAALFYRQNNWRFGLNFNNLFDIKYINSAATFSRTRSIEPGQPFSVIGSIAVEF